jgi:transcriptional regulator with XRE-family HTH domain
MSPGDGQSAFSELREAVFRIPVAWFRGMGRSIVREEAKLSGVGGQMRDRTAKVPPQAWCTGRLRAPLMLGQAVRDDRVRRRLTVREMADAPGPGRGTVSDIETGHVGSLETYARLAESLPLRAEFDLVDPRRRQPLPRRAADPIHAAMGEAQAAQLREVGLEVGHEPFRHHKSDLIGGHIARDSTVTTGHHAGSSRSQPGRIRAAGRNTSASTSPLSGRPSACR